LIQTFNAKYQYNIAFSPDGKTLASGARDGLVRLWSVSDGKLLKTFDAQGSWAESIAFSPNGQILASGHVDMKTRLWQVSDGALLREFEGENGWVLCLDFSPDGEILATVSGKTQLWRVSDGELLRTLAIKNEDQESIDENLDIGSEDVRNLTFSPDGKTLASISNNNNVLLWRVSDGELIDKIAGFSNDVWSVAFSDDGQVLGSNSYYDFTMRHVPDGAEVNSYKFAFGYEISPDWQVAAIPGSLCKKPIYDCIKLWQISDGSLLQELEGIRHNLSRIVFSPDGQLVAAASDDNNLHLWRVSDGKLLLTLVGHTDEIESITFSPDGQTLASGSLDNTVRIWNVQYGTLIQILNGPPKQTYFGKEREVHIFDIAFSQDGETFAMHTSDGSETNTTIWIYKTANWLLQYKFEGLDTMSNGLAFSPDSQILVAGGCPIIIWRIADGILLNTLMDCDNGEVTTSLAFSPDGQLLASPMTDGTIRLWGIP
jgi:WD40 repeat protein